jgi:hypothetical protein
MWPDPLTRFWYRIHVTEFSIYPVLALKSWEGEGSTAATRERRRGRQGRGEGGWGQRGMRDDPNNTAHWF